MNECFWTNPLNQTVSVHCFCCYLGLKGSQLKVQENVLDHKNVLAKIKIYKVNMEPFQHIPKLTTHKSFDDNNFSMIDALNHEKKCNKFSHQSFSILKIILFQIQGDSGRISIPSRSKLYHVILILSQRSLELETCDKWSRFFRIELVTSSFPNFFYYWLCSWHWCFIKILPYFSISILYYFVGRCSFKLNNIWYVMSFGPKTRTCCVTLHEKSISRGKVIDQWQ